MSRRLHRRYGRAARRSAAAYEFLRSMHGWTITRESGSTLVAHRMSAVVGEDRGPDVEFVRVAPGQWRGYYAGRATTAYSPGGVARNLSVPRERRS